MEGPQSHRAGCGEQGGELEEEGEHSLDGNKTIYGNSKPKGVEDSHCSLERCERLSIVDTL